MSDSTLTANGRKRWKLTDEQRRAISERMKGNTNKRGFKVQDTSQFFRGGRPGPQSPAEKAKRAASLERVHRKFRPTKIELVVQDMLNELGIEYVVHKRFGQFTPDIYVPAANLIIEVNGCYWHDCPECYDAEVRPGQRLKDSNRIQLLEEDHKVLVVWQHELECKESVMARIAPAVTEEVN